MSTEERIVELEAALQAERSRRMCREADAKQYYAVIDTAIRVLMQHLYAMEPGSELPSDQGPGGMLAQCVESVLAQHRDDRKALQAEREARVELGRQLEYDRTKVAECMTAANKAVDGRHWLTEGRGSYEWDDDRWRPEFYAAAVEIKAALAPLTAIESCRRMECGDPGTRAGQGDG